MRDRSTIRSMLHGLNWGRGARAAFRPNTAAKAPRLQERKAEQGFALLIVVILLAFVVILLVGLATYTRIESAVATNTQRQAQARQNALLGLDVALAQLQKYAGPDQRVTATAEAVAGVNDQKAHYTGVWHSDITQTADTTTPLAWLVSGAEAATPSEDVTTAIASARAVQLVGTKSAGAANSVVATLQDITATGVPGATGTTPPVIGRYAWWVGDQGVKAPVAVVDQSAKLNYAPFGDGSAQNELGKRVRQRVTTGAGAADAAGAPIFEPHDAANATLVGNNRITAQPQLAFLRTSSNANVGLTRLQENFHTWSPNNFAVLANTKTGGLRQDLSLKPDLLGPGFVAWADYKSYMEDFSAAVTDPTPAILPAYGPDVEKPDPLRRRYKITPPATPGVPGVAPVLTYFYLLVGVRKENGATPYDISLRWAAALWNPYSSALVPEGLRLEISGLPSSIEFVNNDTLVVMASASLRAKYGDPLKVTLPWASGTAASEPAHASWLAGRVYNWVFEKDAPFALNGDNPGRFNSRDLGGFDDGLRVTQSGSGNGSTPLSIRLNGLTRLTVKLVRQSDGATLATYASPRYEALSITAPFDADNRRSQLGFLFRMQESFDTPATPGAWLTDGGRDPRSSEFPSDGMLAVPNGPDPSAYANFTTINAPDRLFDRDITRGTSYNEDVPLFELPRAPLLSLGELQHLPINGVRPFSIGNSWGALAQLETSPLNSVFDRYYFSGLAGSAPDLTAGELLPNPLLVTLPRKSDGAKVATADLTDAPEGRSSKYLLQAGAFDINSVNVKAWASVLRGIRFEATKPFTYVNADVNTGTGPDDAPLELATTNALFFRFPHSAQEVYEADDDYAQSTTSTTDAGPVINTPLFRRGVRSLDASQIAAFAGAIVANIKLKHADSGPFRSLEEFLNPAPALADQSVIEKAIADAGLNSAVAEFSSQWLTQGDIMTALAPVLFPRSDTFVIRAYGEAINPTTGLSEGRAWCEATVQRLPEFFDPTDPPETPLADFDQPADPSDPASTPTAAHVLNKTYGRRFKVVSFRWLTRFDI